MEVKVLMRMTKAQLLATARELGMNPSPSTRKAEIAERIVSFEAEPAPPEDPPAKKSTQATLAEPVDPPTPPAPEPVEPPTPPAPEDDEDVFKHISEQVVRREGRRVAYALVSRKTGTRQSKVVIGAFATILSRNVRDKKNISDTWEQTQVKTRKGGTEAAWELPMSKGHVSLSIDELSTLLSSLPKGDKKKLVAALQ